MIVREIERPAETYGRQPRVPRRAGTLGDRLTRRRLELGLTQKQVAERIIVHPVCVGEMERGRQLPSAPTLAALAVALGCSMDVLWFGEREAS